MLGFAVLTPHSLFASKTFKNAVGHMHIMRDAVVSVAGQLGQLISVQVFCDSKEELRMRLHTLCAYLVRKAPSVQSHMLSFLFARVRI